MEGGGVELVDDGSSAGVDGRLVGVIDGIVIRVRSVDVSFGVISGVSFLRHICFALGDLGRGRMCLAAAMDCLSKRIKKSKSLYSYQIGRWKTVPHTTRHGLF